MFRKGIRVTEISQIGALFTIYTLAKKLIYSPESELNLALENSYNYITWMIYFV